jgi:DNA replicative helicase MCM subunit Mcm2 (Cdc46/Mcm family)
MDDTVETVKDTDTDTGSDATGTSTADTGEAGGDAVRVDGGLDEDDNQGLSQDARATALQDSIDTHNDGTGAPIADVIEDAVEAGADRVLAEQMLKKWRTQGRSYQPSEGRVKYIGGE